jgi:hypothetical protein
MQGTASQYTKYFTMTKEASHYTMTYLNLSQYVAGLQAYYVENARLPSDLISFLRSNFTTKGHDPALDYWETPYKITEKSDRFTLISCGIDRTCPTEDDLSQSAPKKKDSSSSGARGE